MQQAWRKCRHLVIDEISMVDGLFFEVRSLVCSHSLQHVCYSESCILYLVTVCLEVWAGHVSRMGEERRVYRVLLGKSEGRRPLGRPRRRWVDNIRMDLQEVGYRYKDWIGLAQDRDRWRTLVSAVMNLRVL